MQPSPQHTTVARLVAATIFLRNLIINFYRWFGLRADGRCAVCTRIENIIVNWSNVHRLIADRCEYWNTHKKRKNPIVRIHLLILLADDDDDGDAASKLIALTTVLLFREFHFRRGQSKHKDLIAPAENWSDQLNFIGRMNLYYTYSAYNALNWTLWLPLNGFLFPPVSWYGLGWETTSSNKGVRH